MQAKTLTPFELFGNEVRYVVPLFQRPYVWNEETQWEPLWDDVRVLAEREADEAPAAGSAELPSHFLGAIVLDQQPVPPGGFLMARNVIDGQQRLTTLQILLDAAALVVTEHGHTQDAAILRKLVLNDPAVQVDADDRFKVWPTRGDQEAFRAIMDDDLEPTAEHLESRIAQAHVFFVREIQEWCEPSGDAEKCAQRLHHLTIALVRRLRVVAIDLESDDNPQVIFETLNHRGTPLLAADLIKNLVFQRAALEDEDVLELHDQYWQPFDAKSWRKEVRQGRIRRPRIDMFFNHWLVTQLRREVPADRIYTEFRALVDSANAPGPVALLKEAAESAKVYETIEASGPDTAEGRFRYRVIEAMENSTVMPVVLWLYRYLGEDELSERAAVLEYIERYLVRRMITGATTKGYNRLFVDLLDVMDKAVDSPAAAVRQHLAGLTADSLVAASDEDVKSAVLVRPAYTGLKRSRVRLLLEALEESVRTSFSEIPDCPRGLSIEHVLPQTWTLWPLPSDLEPSAAEVRRAQLVHTLGNLTLVTGSLNPALSNNPWTSSDVRAAGLSADKSGRYTGKQDLLRQHTTLRLNLELVDEHPEFWTEADIEARSASLAERIITIWPSLDDRTPGQ